jgi:hypothetical protein
VPVGPIASVVPIIGGLFIGGLWTPFSSIRKPKR